MGASYAYAVGNVRAREPALLTRPDMEQLLGVSDVAELLAALRDRGCGGDWCIKLEHYLRTLSRKPGALPHSVGWQMSGLRTSVCACKRRSILLQNEQICRSSDRLYQHTSGFHSAGIT